MVVIRTVFRLKFRELREAVALVKEGIPIQKHPGANFSARTLADLTRRFYTLMLELTTLDLGPSASEVPVYGK